MAAVRDIIGHVEVEIAVRKRICHHHRNKHSVAAGQRCLAVHESDGGRKNYCLSCGLEIITKAQAKLLILQTQIQGQS
jgi:hypothetical protein